MFGRFSDRVERPSPDRKLDIYTDGNDDYTYVLPEFYDGACINYGQLVKIRERGRLIGKEKRTIYGDPNPAEIETTDVENYNGILRERIGRLVRKTKCFSKKRIRLESALHLFQFYWNFINPFKRKTTPAMLEGLSDHQWSWAEFFNNTLTILN